MHDETIPPGLCQCGCGQRTTIASRTDRSSNRVKGQPMLFVCGHQNRTRNVPACGYVIEDRGHDTPCWVWRLYLLKGYGQTWRSGRLVLAHVAYWTDRNGPVPVGLELDHLCRVTACCNPDHLEPVTSAENTRRSLAAKLTPADVRMIRVSSRTAKALGAQLGVHPSNVSKIRHGRAWRDLP